MINVGRMRLICRGLMSLYTSGVLSQRCLLVAVAFLTNVPPHCIAMPQTRDMAPHPVNVYRHRTGLSLCYSFT